MATTNINLKGSNPTTNDAIALSSGTYIDVTRNSDSQLTFDLSAADGFDGFGTRYLSKDNTWDVPRTTNIEIIVTVVSGKFVLNGTSQADYTLMSGFTYQFNQEDASNSGHPFAFSTNANNSPAAPYTTGVATSNTPGTTGSYTQIQVGPSTPNLYYYCTQHLNMGGSAPREASFISLTTTGTSGDSTLTNGVLNIPNYADGNDNDYLTGLAFDTGDGVLTATVQNQSDVTVADLDGRYLTSYTVPLASSTVRGGIKIGFTESGKNYPVELSSEKAYVNVPWEDNNYYLDGITKAGNVLTFSVSGATNQTYTFGANAFNSTTIYAEPGIFSGAGTPTLATNVTPLEVRTLIGAGTGDGDGTVTSVAQTHEGDAFSVAGTPITSSGTLAIEMEGSASQYINGLGNLITFPTIPQGDVTGISVSNGITGSSLSGPVPAISMSGSYTGNFTVTGDITSSGSSAWLTAQGNVGNHNRLAPLSQGTALGWNYSGGSAEANLLFKGNTTDHANNQLRIASYNGTGSTEVMRIQGNKLVDFQGNISAQGTTILTNSGATSYLAANKYTLIGNHSNPSNTAATFYDQAGQGPTISGFAMCFRTGSTPAQTGKLNSSGTFTVSGDIVAYGSPSDIRLKENIKPIESALDKAMKLQGVTFNWKNKSEDILDIKEDIGFIAQDVQKVLPELVREK